MNKTRFYLLSFIVAGLVLSCTPLPKKAEKKFESAEYNTAIKYYQQLLAKQPAQAGEFNFMIGECYRLSNRLKEALPYYQAAIDAGDVANDNLGFYYGLSLKVNEQYKQAGAQLEKYARSGKNATLIRRARTEVAHLAIIDSIMAVKTYTTIYNCEGINTAAAEYSPVFYNGNLVFSSTRRGEKVFETTGAGFSDLYLYQFSDTSTCAGQIVPLFGPEINTDGMHDASATFAPNNRFMIFARSNSGKKRETYKDVHLFISKPDGDEGWQLPELLDRVTDTASWDASPALSPNGKTLYFASNRKSQSVGGTDIYVSNMNDNGTWTRPRNLGRLVNTPGDEMFPYVAPDGRFFFASNGHPGLGGFDLFMVDTVVTGYDSLRQPIKEPIVKNLGVPINSSSDDFGIVFRQNMNSGYFTSNRTGNGAKGDDDIYGFYNDSSSIKYVTYYLRGTGYGRQENGSEIPLPLVKLELRDGKGTLIDTASADASGRFAFGKAISIDQEYIITGKKADYLDGQVTFSTVGKAIDPQTLPERFNKHYFDTRLSLRKDILAVLRQPDPKIPDGSGGGTPGTTFVKTIPPDQVPEIIILYEYDSARITAEAAKILDEFTEFLYDYFKQYPTTVLELGSHTDTRGGEAYNQRLSQRRAESAVAYIVAKGIPRERIVAKGYGKSEPKIRNARTEAQHQANRRTTIKIAQQ